MPILKELKRMNYSQAWEFFMKNLNMGSKEAYDYLDHIAKKTIVYDMRGRTGIPREIYEGKTLILMDGATCSGKSTITEKISKEFPETVDVLDIDYLVKDWMDNKMSKIKDEREKFLFLLQVEALSDKYLQDNLEEIVSNKAKEGKTVIMVGCFLEFIYRALIGTTLGKYFEKVVFFTVHESMTTLEKYHQKREEYFKNSPASFLSLQQIEETKTHHDFIDKVLTLQPYGFGIGADLSFIIDGRTKLY